MSAALSLSVLLSGLSLVPWAATESCALPESTATAVFSMYCHWTGEAVVGRVPGVLRTRIGQLDGREIVRVEYDPEVARLEELIRVLQGEQSFDERIDPSAVELRFVEPKHSLRARHPELYYLPLTESQAIALNSWSYFGGPMPRVLDERQQELIEPLERRLSSGDRPAVDHDSFRCGAGLDRYRRELGAWLAR